MNRIVTALLTLFVLCVLSGWDFEDEVTAAVYKCDVLGGVWDNESFSCEGVRR